MGAAPYSLDDLTDVHAHLSNHCIAVTHPLYGKWEGEPTNEVFFDRFRHWLAESHEGIEGTPKDFDADVLPQIDRITVHTMLAGKPELENPDPNASAVSFQLWGLDFMLDVDCNATLLEANVSPACAEVLLPQFAADFVEAIIDPLFPSAECNGCASADTESGLSVAVPNHNWQRGFETLWRLGDPPPPPVAGYLQSQ
eukprot:SAG31_NODE_4063_length_3625_cov_1.344016_4_plen_198_part_00